MQARSVSLGAMFAWIPATFRWLGRRTATLMGASLILLLAVIVLFTPMYAVMFATMPMGAAGGPPINPMAGQSTLFWVLYAATIGVSMIVFPPMMAGWFRVARDVDAGVETSAAQILSPYRDPALWGRTVVFGLLAFALYMTLMAVFAGAFYQPVMRFMASVEMQQAALAAHQTPPPPDFPLVLIPAYFLFLGSMLLMQFIYMLGFAEVALRPTSALAALRLAIAGVLRNVFKLALLLIVVFIGAMVVLMIFAVLLALVMVVLSLMSPVLGAIVVFALYVPLILVMYPLMFGGHYFVWKDILGDAQPVAGVEA
jgi:hypothetical protein